MKLMVVVLNQVELLEELLEGFAQAKVNGATILNSRGMARSLYNAGHWDDMLIHSLRAILAPDQDENRTILMVIEDEQVETVAAVAERVMGDLTKPSSGIMFTLPVDFLKGIKPRPTEA